jgi:hypothetical protein
MVSVSLKWTFAETTPSKKHVSVSSSSRKLDILDIMERFPSSLLCSALEGRRGDIEGWTAKNDVCVLRIERFTDVPYVCGDFVTKDS